MDLTDECWGKWEHWNPPTFLLLHHYFKYRAETSLDYMVAIMTEEAISYIRTGGNGVKGEQNIENGKITVKAHIY